MSEHGVNLLGSAAGGRREMHYPKRIIFSVVFIAVKITYSKLLVYVQVS